MGEEAGVNKNRKAVAPVLATLLMIAVAVAMSVIIFMWSQGFLAQTSESTGSQQGSQNQAAQSSVAIESALFAAASNKTIVSVRNVGAVAVSIGSIVITGPSSNAGYTGYISITIPDSGNVSSSNIAKSSGATITISPSTASSYRSVAKGASVTTAVDAAPTGGEANNNDIKSGDTITIKVTTSVGTFAQSSFTVP